MFREFDRLRRDMDRLFEQTLAPMDFSSSSSTSSPLMLGSSKTPSGASGDTTLSTQTQQHPLEPRRFLPAVDVRETDREICVDAELPGMKKEDVHIEWEGDNLRIHGESKREKKEENEHYRRVERSWGSFSRSLHMPNYVKPDETKAEYKDGVLHVHVPKDPSKLQNNKPRRIDIQ